MRATGARIKSDFGSLGGETTYSEYDGKKKPFSIFTLIDEYHDYFYYSENNPAKIVHKDTDEGESD